MAVDILEVVEVSHSIAIVNQQSGKVTQCTGLFNVKTNRTVVQCKKIRTITPSPNLLIKVEGYFLFIVDSISGSTSQCLVTFDALSLDPTGSCVGGARPATLQVTPATNISLSGTLHGPFSPTSFRYQLNATTGGVRYSISGVPNWLTACSTSGTVTTSPATIVFTINGNASSLPLGTQTAVIAFTNTANARGTQSRTATLTVTEPPALLVSPATNISSSGPQGGPFLPTSFQYQLGATTGRVSYSISGIPNWLTVSSTSGTATTSPTIINFVVNSNATCFHLARKQPL
jgi:hypothetical protein